MATPSNALPLTCSPQIVEASEESIARTALAAAEGHAWRPALLVESSTELVARQGEVIETDWPVMGANELLERDDLELGASFGSGHRQVRATGNPVMAAWIGTSSRRGAFE